MTELPTPRELECLALLELPGASYATVARILGLSESTVQNHLGRLYAKLGVGSALQARAALDRSRDRTSA